MQLSTQDKKLNSLYTINDKIKIRFQRENEEVNTEMNHEADLVDIFGAELISSRKEEEKRPEVDIYLRRYIIFFLIFISWY